MVACVSVSWMNTCICLQGDEQIAFEFMDNKKKTRPHFLTLQKNDQQRTQTENEDVLLFLSRKANNAHWCAHSIMPVTQRLSSRP